MRADGRPIPSELMAELEALAAMPDDMIDFSDILRTTDFSGFRRGVEFGASRHAKVDVSIDAAIVAWFAAHTDPGETAQSHIDRFCVGALCRRVGRSERRLHEQARRAGSAAGAASAIGSTSSSACTW